MSAAALFTLSLGAITNGAEASEAGWVLDNEASTVSFGSVKKGSVGEAHHFSKLSGTVNHDGDVAIEVDLTSVETWIDIRNERIMEHVFLSTPAAVFTANVDMASLEGLAVGDIQDTELNGKFTLGAVDIDVQADLVAVRLSETRVMILTAEMFWITTEEAGIDAGVDKLMELAKLPGITRAFPVTLRLVFDHKS